MSEESKTPETDAKRTSMMERRISDMTELWDFARRLELERNDLRVVLHGLSGFLSAGSGDDSTTADQFDERIRWGIKNLADDLEGLLEDARASLAASQKALELLHEEMDRQAGIVAELKKDRERLDWLQSHTKGYGTGWICRDSRTGRGMRLHETSEAGAFMDVRQAIDAAMNNEP